MPTVELTPTQVAFLENWLDADIPDADAADSDVGELLGQIDDDAADPADLWLLARSSAQAELAELRAKLGKSDDPNLQRIAEFGIMDILGGNMITVTSRIVAWRTAGPGERAAKAEALSATLGDLESHLAKSPLVALVEDNVFGLPVDVKTPIQRAIKAIRRSIAA